MSKTLDINRQTAATFVGKAQEFLKLPYQLWDCDIKQCNPKLYKGVKGKAAITRAKKGLILLERINKDLIAVRKLLK